MHWHIYEKYDAIGQRYKCWYRNKNINTTIQKFRVGKPFTFFFLQKYDLKSNIMEYYYTNQIFSILTHLKM